MSGHHYNLFAKGETDQKDHTPFEREFIGESDSF